MKKREERKPHVPETSEEPPEPTEPEEEQQQHPIFPLLKKKIRNQAKKNREDIQRRTKCYPCILSYIMEIAGINLSRTLAAASHHN